MHGIRLKLSKSEDFVYTQAGEAVNRQAVERRSANMWVVMAVIFVNPYMVTEYQVDERSQVTILLETRCLMFDGWILSLVCCCR